jgi:hypothetical protein
MQLTCASKKRQSKSSKTNKNSSSENVDTSFEHLDATTQSEGADTSHHSHDSDDKSPSTEELSRSGKKLGWTFFPKDKEVLPTMQEQQSEVTARMVWAKRCSSVWIMHCMCICCPRRNVVHALGIIIRQTAWRAARSLARSGVLGLRTDVSLTGSSGPLSAEQGSRPRP